MTIGASPEPFGASPDRPSWGLARAWTFPAAAAGIIFSFMTFRADAPRIFAGVNDFLGIYAGARLAGSPEQFNAAAYMREQRRATGWEAPSILNTRLPAFAILLRPLGKLPYLEAYAVWQGLSLSAFAAFLMISPFEDRLLLLLAACWSFPLAADLAGGQDVAFLLLVVAIGCRLVRPAPVLSGAVLALGALKFQLFLLVPILLAAQRRWRMLAGASVTGGMILGICFAAAGPNWIPEYTHFVLQERTNPSVRAMPNLRGLLEALPHALAWEISGAMAVTLAVALIGRRSSFSIGLSAALAGSLLTSHHAYPADALLLLPALLTVATEVRFLSVRVLCLLLLTPVPFLVRPLHPLVGPAPLLLVALVAVLLARAGTSADAESMLPLL